ncbi:hypothetical protein FRC12_021879 [Ceratobasidium sp. 428]|nr:hypothetical protein FRC12_021879 [Ceratobasidium sp. 428]
MKQHRRILPTGLCLLAPGSHTLAEKDQPPRKVKLPECSICSMRFSTIISTLALGLSTVLTVSGQRKCGSELSAEKVAEAEAHFASNKVEASALELAEAKNSGKKGVKLNVYWHVVYAGKSLKKGYVPDSQIKKNIAQTNHDYSKTGIQLKLMEITRTHNP